MLLWIWPPITVQKLTLKNLRSLDCVTFKMLNRIYDSWLRGAVAHARYWALLHPDYGLLLWSPEVLWNGQGADGSTCWRQLTAEVYVVFVSLQKSRKVSNDTRETRQIKTKSQRRFVRIVGVNNGTRRSGFYCHLAVSPGTTGAARTRALWPKRTKSWVFTLILLKRDQH